MKFEGIEIALEGICLHTRYLLAQFQFLRISYSLKASAEERATERSHKGLNSISMSFELHQDPSR
jgi:hypothetical protein